MSYKNVVLFCHESSWISLYNQYCIFFEKFGFGVVNFFGFMGSIELLNNTPAAPPLIKPENGLLIGTFKTRDLEICLCP